VTPIVNIRSGFIRHSCLFLLYVLRSIRKAWKKKTFHYAFLFFSSIHSTALHRRWLRGKKSRCHLDDRDAPV